MRQRGREGGREGEREKARNGKQGRAANGFNSFSIPTIGLYNHSETRLRNCSVNSSPVTVPKVLGDGSHQNLVVEQNSPCSCKHLKGWEEQKTPNLIHQACAAQDRCCAQHGTNVLVGCYRIASTTQCCKVSTAVTAQHPTRSAYCLL